MGLGTEPRQPCLCPHLAAPTEDNLQVSLGVGELAQPAQLSPWLSGLCFHKVNVFCQKNVPSYIFFFHWLYGNTVPFFSWHPSWCLPFLWCIPSPPFIMKRGCPDALAQNWFALGKKNHTFLQIKSLFSMERLDFVFTWFLKGFVGILLFCYRVFWGIFKLFLLGASLELSMKMMMCFLAEFPKEMKLLLSVSLLCLRVREISNLPAHPSQI